MFSIHYLYEFVASRNFYEFVRMDISERSLKPFEFFVEKAFVLTHAFEILDVHESVVARNVVQRLVAVFRKVYSSRNYRRNPVSHRPVHYFERSYHFR